MQCYKVTSKKVKGNGGNAFVPPTAPPIKSPDQILAEKKASEEAGKAEELKKAAIARSQTAAAGAAAAAASASTATGSGTAAADGTAPMQQG